MTLPKHCVASAMVLRNAAEKAVRDRRLKSLNMTIIARYNLEVATFRGVIVKNKGSLVAFCMAFVLNATSMMPASACTDFLIATKDGASIVGRSMEWGLDLDSHICLYPRGESRSSQTAGGNTGVTWKSKYGYLGLDAHGMPLALDGMNEKGLSMGLLWLPGTIYQDVPVESPQMALSAIDLWHWILGNFTTVDEVKSAIGKVRVWSPKLADWGGTPTAHVSLHDAQGNSAVIEFIDGQQKIYANPGGVLTNAPAFDWHTTNLRNYVRLSAANSQPVQISGTVLAPPGQGGGF